MRGGDGAACRRGGGAQALVVGDQPGEIAAELTRGGEVDRVQRAKLGRQQRAGGGEDTVADPDQLQPREHLLPRRTAGSPSGSSAPGHLRSRKHARDQRQPAA